MKYPADLYPGCPCYACDSKTWPKIGSFTPRIRMSICPDCGNKRCPRAASHDNQCTESNETGQEGSLY